MGRKPSPQPLMLAEPNSTLEASAEAEPRFAETAQEASPVASRSPVSLRSSPFASRFASKRPQPGKSAPQPMTDDDVTQRCRSPAGGEEDSAAPASAFDPPPPASNTKPAAKHQGPAEPKKASKSGFFHFNKSSKGFNQLLIPTTQQRRQGSREHLTSSGSDGATAPRRRESPCAHETLHKPTPSLPSRSELSLSSIGDHETTVTSSPGKPTKSNPFGLLGRTKSTHEIKGVASPKAGPAALHVPAYTHDSHEQAPPPKTAPFGPDRSFRDMMSLTVRNRSEDRAPSRDANKDFGRDRDQRTLSSLRDNSGSNFLSGLRSSSTKAADLISKGLFGKSPRGGGGGASDKDFVIDDEHYVPKVIHLSLVEQTRLTRISKRLEDSKDKTEFWMPAFPWRAIDYLNYKGCDVEGLYRVPGSGPQVKKWQRRFDEYHDVNLFEQDGLYDINIIGSMLKAWLRELPDELFPKEAQDRISRECAGSTQVPQMLIDELSELSPFNYYLLFAITCHLSLLLAHSDKNKMDFRNLCICFQPCMKIDAFCFKFLVCDWRDCWKGCKNEARYIEEEYALFAQPPPRRLSEPRQPGKSDERVVSSPDSARKTTSGNSQGKRRTKKHRQDASGSNASIGSSNSSPSTNPSTHGDRNAADGSRDIRPLSPIKPLSPLGF